MKGFPVLTTPRLILRALGMKDVPRLLALFRDPEVSRYLSRDMSKLTVKDERKFIRRTRKGFEAGSDLHWGICEKDTGALIGGIGVSGIHRGHQSAMAGFWLGREYWGRGYMTEALGAVLSHCFNEMKLNRVWAGHFAGNPASGRVQQKCGLRYEGTHRQQFCREGRFMDSLTYAILREDFANSDTV